MGFRLSTVLSFQLQESVHWPLTTADAQIAHAPYLAGNCRPTVLAAI